YGNSHGFIGGYAGSRHSLSCAVVGEQDGEMQRNYWYTLARDATQLDSPQQVGETAADRTLARLGARRIPTQQAAVLFQAD
ncbi:peptidase PmbA, partial [Candidatus Endoriftia persephone str. Guaymas]|nr:peptidase PmbA [Candidatus Endoriftia persephone str. Guaymas]